jgi:hypothetical protein
MSEMSTFGPLGTSIVPVASGGAGPTNVGGALATPTSSCQFLATRPTDDAAISTKNASTTSSDAKPTRSARKRRQAACQTPSERSTAGSAGRGSTALT